MIGGTTFVGCSSLVEADFSSTSITEIPNYGFDQCGSLQRVSLPKSLDEICEGGFCEGPSLVSVTIPVDSNPINIERMSFRTCKSLANLLFPEGTTATQGAFNKCRLIQDRFGLLASGVVDSLVRRFDKYPVHRMCYDHSATTIQDLSQCIMVEKRRTANEASDDSAFVDDFGMTPFHVLFSTVNNPRQEDLLDVLVDNFPWSSSCWNYKDANGKLAADYLVSNWTKTTGSCLLRRLIVDPLVRWGATSWTETMQSMVQAVVDTNDQEQRASLWNEARVAFEQYYSMEVTSI